MIRYGLAGALAGLVALSHTSVTGQNHPDFTGYWTLESPAQQDPDIPPVLGVRLQAGTPESLLIERRYSARIERASHKLNVVGGSVVGTARSLHSARWEGTTLVLVQGAYARNGGGARDWSERREEWTLDQDGKLRVTISMTGAQVNVRQISARYRRLTLRPVADPEAYAVYSSLLPQEWLVRTAHAKVLVFQSETATYNGCLPTGKSLLARDWQQVLGNYALENTEPRLLVPGKSLLIPYVVVPREQIEAAFQKPAANDNSFGWARFHQQYPESHGYMQLSAVGFNPSKTRALVYVSHHCGGLCGGGTHHLLEKVNGAWRPAQLDDVTMCRWAS